MCTHLGEGSTASRVVDDVSDNTLDVAVTLGEILWRERERREVGAAVSY
jgi:hypothetical protein